MGLKFTNFATSTIANVGGIGSGDLSLDVQPGDGALFPSLGGSDYFYCVLVDTSANREVIKVTARSTDTFTIVRGQDGSTPRVFSEDDKIELRPNQGAFEDIIGLISELNPFIKSRSIFTYNGGAAAYTVKCGAASYYVKDKVAYWLSELTTVAIGTPSADTWYYLYLDYSAITSGTQITNSELIWSSAGPTYSHSLGGWYNGDDLCIYATFTNSGPTNILESYHDGGRLIQWDLNIAEGAISPNGTWTDVDMSSSMPAFATKADIVASHEYGNSSTQGYVRKNGSSSNGIWLGAASSGDNKSNQLAIYTDASQIIEVLTLGTNTITVYNKGWYFPAGM